MTGPAKPGPHARAKRESGPQQPMGVDWAAVRERLSAATGALERSLQPGSVEARAVLEERARRLAQAPREDERPGGRLQVVTFSLADERYAIGLQYVREISRLTELTPVPGAGDFLVGVTNLRGEVLAIVHLRRFFGLAERGVTDLSRVIVLGEQRNEFGVLADQVHEVAVLRAADAGEPPQSSPSPGRAYILGVTRDALIVLDGDRLLRDERLYIDQRQEGTWPGKSPGRTP